MPCNNCNNSTPCNCSNNCNDCGNTHIQTHICNPCSTPPPCDCPVVDLSTDCVLYNQDPITCNNVVVVPQNTNLTTSLQNIVAWVCSRLSEDINFFTLKNVGTGVGVYKGTNLVGEKELKSLTSTNGSLNITSNTNTIDLSVNYSETNPCLISESGAIGIAYNSGTECFNFEAINQQKIISTFPYTLSNIDNRYTIFVDNGTNNVVINVPNTLGLAFVCVFIQKGTGTVTIQQTGTALVLHPSTFENKIKGQFYWALLEKEVATNNYYLMGSLKPL